MLMRQWPAHGDAVRLIYVGTLNYERNLLSVCKAVMEANAAGMNFILTLVGSGTEQRELKAFARNTGGRLWVMPPVPHECVPELLASAHVGVLAFPDEEKYRVSSPIKLFEYMATGLPILATRVACHTDVVRDGNYAFWAEDASKEGLLAGLRQIDSSRDALRDMGGEAYNASQEWTWARSARKLEMALEKGIAAAHG
jgi:glycosyltransferase involved in cell wall biosynthesis